MGVLCAEDVKMRRCGRLQGFPGHFRGVCPVPACLRVHNRAAEKLLCIGVYRRVQEENRPTTGAGLIFAAGVIRTGVCTDYFSPYGLFHKAVPMPQKKKNVRVNRRTQHGSQENDSHQTESV